MTDPGAPAPGFTSPSYILEAIHSMMVTCLDWRSVAAGYIVAFAFLALTSTSSVLSFRKLAR